MQLNLIKRKTEFTWGLRWLCMKRLDTTRAGWDVVPGALPGGEGCSTLGRRCPQGSHREPQSHPLPSCPCRAGSGDEKRRIPQENLTATGAKEGGSAKCVGNEDVANEAALKAAARCQSGRDRELSPAVGAPLTGRLRGSQRTRGIFELQPFCCLTSTGWKGWNRPARSSSPHLLLELPSSPGIFS